MKTLIAGFGNILRSDDGFGVAVVRRLRESELPPEVEIADIGIGGLHFVSRLQFGYERVIVVDAVSSGTPAGTVRTFTPDTAPRTVTVDPHLAEPQTAFALAAALHVLPAQITIVGCEPRSVEIGVGLTPPVAAAIDEAVNAIRRLIAAEGVAVARTED